MWIELCRFDEATDDHRMIASENTNWKIPMPVFTLDDQPAGFITDFKVEDNRLFGDLPFDLDTDMFCITIGMDRTIIDTSSDLHVVTGRVLYAKVTEDDGYPWKG